LFQILFLPIWGAAADRWGSARILGLCLVCAAAAYCIFATATAYPVLLLSRALAGATSATLGIARGSLADPGNPERTRQNLRLFGAAQGLGFLLGPVLGSTLQWVSTRAPIWLAAGLCLIAALFFLREKWPKAPTSLTAIGWREKLALLVKNTALRFWAEIFFLVTMAFAFLFVAFPLFLNSAYGYTARGSGFYFSILALSAVCGQMFVLPNLQKKLSDRQILFLSCSTMAIGTFALVMIRQPYGTGIILGVTSVALFNALQISMVRYGNASPEADKNLAAGTSEAMGALARLLGTLVSGFLIQKWGLEFAFAVSALLAMTALLRVIFSRTKFISE
jgi:DHA1 family tetracycline resistance protein-like MFS transporter